MKTVRIGRRLVGEGQQAYIISEAGINHNGFISLALNMVRKSKAIGADCIKFQKRTIEDIAIKRMIVASHKNKLDALNGLLEFEKKDYDKIVAECKRLKIDFSASVWDIKSADFIAKYNPTFIKIASADLTNLPLLEHVAKLKFPIILSTGMATIPEIDTAVKLITKYNKKLILLQCSSSYPSKFTDIHLKGIDFLKKRYNIPVGYSGHEPGIHIPLAAVALGACVIEKHVTISKTLPGPDQKASNDFIEYGNMVKQIKDIESAMQERQTNVLKNEQFVRKLLVKSLVTARDIKKGEKIRHGDLTLKAPGDGLTAGHRAYFINKRARRNLSRDYQIKTKDVK